MGDRDEEGVRRFVEHMAMSWAEWGFPRMAARVLMVMMAADEEALTAAELGDRLEISPAAVSGAVRYLIQIGMLAREPVPRPRRKAGTSSRHRRETRPSPHRAGVINSPGRACRSRAVRGRSGRRPR